MTAPTRADVEALLPCPFCGRAPDLVNNPGEDGKDNWYVTHHCEERDGLLVQICTWTRSPETKPAAIVAWNRRAPLGAPQAAPAAEGKPTPTSEMREVAQDVAQAIANNILGCAMDMGLVRALIADALAAAAQKAALEADEWKRLYEAKALAWRQQCEATLEAEARAKTICPFCKVDHNAECMGHYP